MTTYVTTIIDSPVGPLTLLGSDAGLRAVLWPTDTPGERVSWPDHPVGQADHPVLRSRPPQHPEGGTAHCQSEHYLRDIERPGQHERTHSKISSSRRS